MRRPEVYIAILLCVIACTVRRPADYNAVRYVDPQIGSVHGRWFFYTPAAVPFGMAKLAPHTNAYGSAGGWGPCGYDDRHTSIEGFGHFHEFQIGGVIFMPVTGTLQTVPGSLENPDTGYRSRFEKRTEISEPGYYSVFLEDYGIKAELTATERTGFHRYTFSENSRAHLIIDIGHRQGESGEVTLAAAKLVNGNEVEGMVESYPEYAKYDPHYFVKNGYVPYKDTVLSNGWVFNFGASHTLEYAFSSYAVAQMAVQLGKAEDYKTLIRQAGYYKNLYDPETGFIRPRKEDGTFMATFDPMKAWDGFQEGNAFQYTWYVPHDVAGLIGLLGKEKFNQRLSAMFEQAQASHFGGDPGEVDSFSGIAKMYNHGNQPCLHDAWLFNYSGLPWLTQKWTRAICDGFYGTEPLRGYGIGQDEDQGQLGAWFVMAALGLFDVQGHAAAQPTFQFGSPCSGK